MKSQSITTSENTTYLVFDYYKTNGSVISSISIIVGVVFISLYRCLKPYHNKKTKVFVLQLNISTVDGAISSLLIWKFHFKVFKFILNLFAVSQRFTRRVWTDPQKILYFHQGSSQCSVFWLLLKRIQIQLWKHTWPAQIWYFFIGMWCKLGFIVRFIWTWTSGNEI